jgi:3',5'-cyclic AMP phosphodiesterase CpdA
MSRLAARPARVFFAALLLALAMALPAAADFTFAVCADPRPGDFTKPDGTGWDSALRVIKQWQRRPPANFQAPAFLVIVGDYDPAAATRRRVREVLGPKAVWYPVVGNHDLSPEDLAVVRNLIFPIPALPGIVNSGPVGSEGLMYSFDHDDAHFIVVNEYYDGQKPTGSSGDITEATLAWLKADLERNRKRPIFVFGHEPAFPEYRHVGDSLDQFPAHRDAFWDLLVERGVSAFFVGHTHYYSRTSRRGVWQIDAGQIRGVFAREENDRRNTIVLVRVGEAGVRYAVMQSGGERPFEFKPAVEWSDLRRHAARQP